MNRIQKINKFIQHLQDRIRLTGGIPYRIYTVLRILVIITAVRSWLAGSYENLALCILSLLLFLLPSFFEERLQVDIPPMFESIIYIFIFAAEILGEVNKYYTAIPGWDTMLHTINGFLCAAIGFSMVYILNRKSNLMNLSPFYLAMVAFCFSMTIGVIWEFIEFNFDQLLGLDMQKDFIVTSISSVTLDPNQMQIPQHVNNIVRTIVETADGTAVTIEGGYLDIGILDTMKDLLVNFVGAIVFSTFGYLYVRHNEKRSQASGGEAGKVAMGMSDSIASALIVRSITTEELEHQNEEIDKMRRQQKKNRRFGRRKRSKSHIDKSGAE